MAMLLNQPLPSAPSILKPTASRRSLLPSSNKILLTPVKEHQSKSSSKRHSSVPVLPSTDSYKESLINGVASVPTSVDHHQKGQSLHATEDRVLVYSDKQNAMLPAEKVSVSDKRKTIHPAEQVSVSSDKRKSLYTAEDGVSVSENRETVRAVEQVSVSSDRRKSLHPAEQASSSDKKGIMRTTEEEVSVSEKRRSISAKTSPSTRDSTLFQKQHSLHVTPPVQPEVRRKSALSSSTSSSSTKASRSSKRVSIVVPQPALDDSVSDMSLVSSNISQKMKGRYLLIRN